MKTIQIEGVGEVVIKKSRRTGRLILKINHVGQPTVTIPAYAPYAVGEAFARKHRSWYLQHLPATQAALIENGTQVGKHHTIRFASSDEILKPSIRVANTTITIKHPAGLPASTPAVQAAAQTGAARALRRQAETVLPSWLSRLAKAYGYSYREIRIKKVHTRWGSCSSNKIINLSIWLMQLPDPLIEYVLCHELTHLNHLNHSPAFWAELARMVPDYKERRKQLKAYRPALLQA